MSRQTTARKIADRLRNDGTNYHTAKGKSLDSLCRQAGAFVEKGKGKNYDSVRYVFRDGSVIVDGHGKAWDFEGKTPWSFQGSE